MADNGNTTYSASTPFVGASVRGHLLGNRSQRMDGVSVATTHPKDAVAWQR